MICAVCKKPPNECRCRGFKKWIGKDRTMTDAKKPEEEIAELKQWVNDLQSGMYINCVYCGHRYGPNDEVPASMADALKEHVEQCPKHPMSALKKELERLKTPTLSIRAAAEEIGNKIKEFYWDHYMDMDFTDDIEQAIRRAVERDREERAKDAGINRAFSESCGCPLPEVENG